MNRMLPVLFSLVTAAIMVSYDHASAATTVRTPFILASTEIGCLVTNIGTKPLDVTVSVISAAGASLPASTDSCNGTPVAPKNTCYLFVTSFPVTPPMGGFCSFTGGGKFRAVGYGTSGGPVVTFPATK